jgi:hypothetical protein
MIELLSSSAYLIVNKDLSHKVGLQAAALLADLITKQLYFEAEHGTVDYFFNTVENIQKDTTLSAYQQRAAVAILKRYKLIDTKRKGIPAKKYFKVNAEQVMQFLNYKDLSSLNTTNNNNKINNNNNTTNIPGLELRKAKFLEEAFLSNGDKQINGYSILAEEDLKEFCNYWTEPNRSKTKLNFELQRTWSMDLRIKNWARNIKNWGRKDKVKGKIDAQIDEYNKGKEYL